MKTKTSFRNLIHVMFLILIGIMALALMSGREKYFLANPTNLESSLIASEASEPGST